MWFYPLQKVLRSEKRLDQLKGSRIPGALLQVGGVIPGQQLRIDTKSKQALLIDRMTLPENREIDESLRRLTQTDQYRTSAYGQYEKEESFKIAHKDWATFLYHIRNLVNNERFVVVSGEKLLPSIPDILEIGDVQLGDNCNVTPIDKDRPFYMANKEHFGGTPYSLAKVGT